MVQSLVAFRAYCLAVNSKVKEMMGSDSSLEKEALLRVLVDFAKIPKETKVAPLEADTSLDGMEKTIAEEEYAKLHRDNIVIDYAKVMTAVRASHPLGLGRYMVDAVDHSMQTGKSLLAFAKGKVSLDPRVLGLKTTPTYFERLAVASSKYATTKHEENQKVDEGTAMVHAAKLWIKKTTEAEHQQYHIPTPAPTAIPSTYSSSEYSSSDGGVSAGCKCVGGAAVKGNTCTQTDGESEKWCYVQGPLSCKATTKECEEGACKWWSVVPCGHEPDAAAIAKTAALKANPALLKKAINAGKSPVPATCACIGDTGVGNKCHTTKVGEKAWCHIKGKALCGVYSVQHCEEGECSYYSEAPCEGGTWPLIPTMSSGYNSAGTSAPTTIPTNAPSKTPTAAPTYGDLLSTGKPATQSSTTDGGEASRAVDGNFNQDFNQGASCTHTAAAAKPWWRVDLQREATVNSVKVWNRVDCCGDRLNGFKVKVDNTDCGTSPTVSATTKTVDVACGQELPAVGTTVEISLDNPQAQVALTLCEVQVYGTWNTPAPPPTEAVAYGSD